MSTRALASIAVTGQVVFVTSWIAAGLAQDGYSASRQTVSELFSRAADHPWILWIGLTALVPSYLATAMLLVHGLGRRGRPAAALFGLAIPLVLVVLVSPLDCMTNGDPACVARVDAGDVSGAHHRHNLAAVALQLCLLATPFATALALRGTRRTAALTAGLVGLVTLAWVALSGPGSAVYGIAERTTFGFVDLWVIAIAAAALAWPTERDTVLEG